MKPCVYILANRRHGFLYIGVTSDIRRRLTEHRAGRSRHTAKNHIIRLVYLEFHQEIGGAIRREKNLKVWRRGWKIRLIEETNPDWNDLVRDFVWLD